MIDNSPEEIPEEIKKKPAAKKTTKKMSSKKKPVKEKIPVEKEPTLPEGVIKIIPVDVDDMDSFIASMMGEFKEVVQREEAIERRKNVDINFLESNVQEFLKSFIIVGYDLHGRQIECMHANTQEEYAACKEALKHTFMKLVVGGQQGGGGADQFLGPPPPGMI